MRSTGCVGLIGPKSDWAGSETIRPHAASQRLDLGETLARAGSVTSRSAGCTDSHPDPSSIRGQILPSACRRA